MNQETQPTLGYILKGYPRISETFISNEILLLEQAGFRMRLFSMRKPRENFCHESVKKIKARVNYLPTELLTDFPRLLAPNIFCAVRNPKSYCASLSLAARRFRRTRRTATFKHLFQAGYMVQKHINKDPAIAHLHGHFAHSPTSVTMFAAQLSGLPFSFTAHAKDIYTSNADQLQEKISKAVFVATCTKYNKEHLKKLAGKSKTPIHCIYHGIDLSLFKSTNEAVETTPPYQFLTVARMTEKKGLPTVYRALKILADRNISFHHTLIGDGDDRESILQLIDDLGLKNNCSWLGTTTHKEVLAAFNNSDLFVLGCEVAQNGDRDGIPNVLVESLAMGVPAISTTVSALPEILMDGKTGLTVEPGDASGLADTMIRLLEDTPLRQKVITNGKQLVETSFDNTKLISALAEIFRTATPAFSLAN